MRAPPPVAICGLINMETTVRVEGFPLHYFPVTYPFNGIGSTVSGVGYNIAAAIRALGGEPRLFSMTGSDETARLVHSAMQKNNLSIAYLYPGLSATPQSVILYDPQGKRQIHVDLKDAQDQAYPLETALAAARDCPWALLCNINFARKLLAPFKNAGHRIATDVHALSDPYDAYNADFMQHAEVLFVSNEHIAGHEKSMLTALMTTYAPRIIVCGMGQQGALLLEREIDAWVWHHEPAVQLRPVVSTIGAGDALFSSFNHFIAQGRTSKEALHLATHFAAWKIGEPGAAQGFLDEATLLTHAATPNPQATAQQK